MFLAAKPGSWVKKHEFRAVWTTTQKLLDPNLEVEHDEGEKHVDGRYLVSWFPRILRETTGRIEDSERYGWVVNFKRRRMFRSFTMGSVPCGQYKD